MKKPLILLSLLSASAAFSTTLAAAEPAWNQIQASYLDSSLDLDGNSLSLDGFALFGSAELTEQWFILGNYDSLSFGDSVSRLDFDTLSAGAGFRKSVSEQTDVFTTITFERVNVETAVAGFGSTDESDNGFGIGVGVRSHINQRIELGAKADYVVIDNEDIMRITADSYFHVTDNISLGLGYQLFSITDSDFDINTFKASIRYAF